MSLRRTCAFRSVRWVLAALPAIILASCAAEVSDEVLNAAYQQSLVDTQTVIPSEISTNLEAIVASNPDLTWEGEPGHSRLLVTTWTTWNGYEQHLGQGPWPTAKEVWIVIPGELKAWMHTHRLELNGDARTLRLEELFGMPPHSNHNWFVDLWVDTRDLFRPSPDPEITDREAELTFPQSDLFLTVNPDYVQWFNDLMAISYTSATAHPWTRLGYTYDWCPSASTREGLSEFVVQQNAPIEVAGVWTTETYGN